MAQIVTKLKRFVIYACRWQLSSIILAPVIWLVPNQPIVAAIVANLIGACVFFPIDMWIFKKRKVE